ncbi:putative circularly permuted ATP-grasp superfamily protein/putative alpha-E superfamily protein [Sphingobium fontiphilum]|uniref:Putative circularly permuted ATP-grasp superfamily protein/putative alpha-E superfamily protein n=1 Tax=Sphingobium fontiphilum TaxID=944425 RepID=A0A7W6GPN0_9SPHN|nr:putative circularly permuted ATP-grasp superfamily protein/putative alpha-E superfamily protein [Sphingobium fontiphilum]
MASGPVTTTDAPRRDRIADWASDYLGRAPAGDLFAAAPAETRDHWRAMMARLSTTTQGRPAALAELIERQAVDLGMAFRLTGDQQERAWPLSPLPLLVGASEWALIERGLSQRAELLERVLSDIYGAQALISDGSLPAAIVTGSPHHWPVVNGVRPPGDHHLHFYAADLARGPEGEWRVLADRVRTPVGVGYALENRLALSRATGDLMALMHTRRLAPFFADMRRGLAADCARAEPRIGLLTPGRFNQSYAEQAHLARYLGFLLVDGEDLIVSEGQLYVRTIQGLKRVDGLWRWMDSRFLDPLAFDGRSTIGVPDLFDACQHGRLMLSNWPGAGVIESRAFAAFMPRLSEALTGEPLILPNIATWWCGQDAEHDHVADHLDDLVIGSAFDREVAGLEGRHFLPGSAMAPERRDRLLRAMARRPMDYVGQEVVRLSTTPAIVDGDLTPLPFTLRVFVARDGDGQWKIMPGAFARLAAHGDIRAALMGEGDLSADMCVIDAAPVPPDSLLGSSGQPAIRRVVGMLPAKAADNLYWLGRYIERAESTLRIVRAIVGGSLEADMGLALDMATKDRLLEALVSRGAIASTAGPIGALCATAMGDAAQPGSARALMTAIATIGAGLRDRLAVDFWRIVRLPLPHFDAGSTESLLEASSKLIDRLSALSGLAAENMLRTDGWRFHDMGRRIERAINACRLASAFGGDSASDDDLSVLLDLNDSQISYRNRYLAGPSLLPVRDLVLLDPANPHSLAFQVARLAEHLAVLPVLARDGLPEIPQRLSGALAAELAPMTGDNLTMDAVEDLEYRLLTLSDAIGQRYFLQYRKTDKAEGSALLS